MAKGLNQKVASEAMSAQPSQLVELYIIYYNWPDDPNSILAFTPMSNGLGSVVTWQGQEYMSIPMEASGFSASGSDELPRPRLKISNKDFEISKYLKITNNLVGAKIVRKRTFVKFLDDVNFANGQNPYFDLRLQSSMADEMSYLPEQVFYVNRRVSEHKESVELELSTVFELDNVYIPNRNVYATYCTWVYRGHGCRYSEEPITQENSQGFTNATGGQVAPSNNRGAWKQENSYNEGDYVYSEVVNFILRSDEEVDLDAPAERLKTFYVCVQSGASGNLDFPPTSNKWQKDECSKKISDCKLRFGNKLRFGGFPGTYEYPPR